MFDNKLIHFYDCEGGAIYKVTCLFIKEDDPLYYCRPLFAKKMKEFK